ncbi:uncharacterized protein LOC127167268 [Labeo rohita]|uniref:uncharacterized protein LOC127167268 n=1 Tax=Labeo rohita TaxID=84645 RepID=UPI0021E31648|nr:uncharacterized protein LOC127167268 [Labeo rohita]
MGLLSAFGYLVLFSSLFTHGGSEVDVAVEVQPDSRQHFRGKNFTLLCSVNSGNSTGLILKSLQGNKTISGCSQLNGTESTDRVGECHFIDIDYKNSGLYWCEIPAENKTSKAVNITVSSDSEASLVWLSGLCIILVFLVLLPVIWLLFPGFREKLHVCLNRGYKREGVQQEMPKTKQDVTEIQWDLPWMEMDNLLDKHQNPGS